METGLYYGHVTWALRTHIDPKKADHIFWLKSNEKQGLYSTWGIKIYLFKVVTSSTPTTAFAGMV